MTMQSLENSFGFIGIGNMGFAMLNSAVKVYSKDYFTYTDINKERLEFVKKETGADFVNTINECVEKSDVIVLAVKPQYMNEVIDDINKELIRGKIVITIAPGVTIDAIKEAMGVEIKVVRAMPNTPALIGEGVSAITLSNDAFTETETKEIKAFFETFGDLVELKEKQLDMVVPVSGSSPAYVYMFIEAMADAGVLMGLPRDISYKLAANAVKGSAAMVLETGMHPGILKDQVCSPGGTTIEAVKVLEENAFRGTIIEAMEACYNKTKKF